MTEFRHTPECFAAHMGIYACEPHWMREAVAHIKAGRAPSRRAATTDPGAPLFMVRADGIAVVPISGPMFKGFSKYSEANTIAIRQAVREAAASADVKGILLAIDSPGGTVAGTSDLADEVAQAGTVKPVHAYIEDFGASAAYWVASQAGRITANPTAEVGSIGTLAVVEDTSGAAQMAGVVVHVISTGPYKGAFVDGAPVTPEHLADLQRRIDALNAHFLDGVARGRRMTTDTVQALADGRMHIASQAQQLGLIDAVGPLESAVSALRAQIDLRAAAQNSRESQDSQGAVSRRRRAAALISITELGG